eukprot:m.210456 g.210456  ORF g.210456 m.210456 type:complete len:80 (-) comp53958_c0_seq13:753-992(-)
MCVNSLVQLSFADLLAAQNLVNFLDNRPIVPHGQPWFKLEGSESRMEESQRVRERDHMRVSEYPFVVSISGSMMVHCLQ